MKTPLEIELKKRINEKTIKAKYKKKAFRLELDLEIV